MWPGPEGDGGERMTLESSDGALQASEGALLGSSLVVESFNDPIRATTNDAWRMGDGMSIEPDADYAFVGPYAGVRVEGTDPMAERKEFHSMPGEGLARYPKPGDTIRMAVAPQTTEDPRNYVGFGFGKPDDAQVDNGLNHSYVVRLDISTYNDEFSIRRDDGFDDETVLGEDKQNITDEDWFILEAVYDGAGTGEHIARWYQTTWDGPGTGQRAEKIGEVVTPADTTYRGEGVGVQIAGPGYMDELTIIPG